MAVFWSIPNKFVLNFLQIPLIACGFEGAGWVEIKGTLDPKLLISSSWFWLLELLTFPVFEKSKRLKEFVKFSKVSHNLRSDCSKVFSLNELKAGAFKLAYSALISLERRNFFRFASFLKTYGQCITGPKNGTLVFDMTDTFKIMRNKFAKSTFLIKTLNSVLLYNAVFGYLIWPAE